MRSRRWVAPFGLSLVVICGCSSGDHAPSSVQRSPEPSASVAKTPEVPAVPPVPASQAQEVSFETSDKIPLSGTLYRAGDDTAPVLVFVHRFRGDRKEWEPLADKLAGGDKRFNIVNFDLRGHGQSVSASGKKRLDWSTMKPKDMPAFVLDVRAAIAFGASKTADKARGVVVVGSSLGAAFAARAASMEPKVTAIGLVSPGAAIEGFDVYHPFADVRMLPSFIAGAKDDNVSREPVTSLAQMAKDLGTVKVYDGKAHGALGLSQEGDPIFADLTDWLATVYDAAPKDRPLFSDRKEAKR